MTSNIDPFQDFDKELAAEERANDEAYGESHDAWFKDKVLGAYKRIQNERLMNAVARRAPKSYVPKQRKGDE